MVPRESWISSLHRLGLELEERVVETGRDKVHQTGGGFGRRFGHKQFHLSQMHHIIDLWVLLPAVMLLLSYCLPCIAPDSWMFSRNETILGSSAWAG